MGSPRAIRAISPVVATALLVLIAVVVSVLLYTWISGMVSTQPVGEEYLQARLAIDAVSYSKGELTIYVRNLGPIPVNLSTVYVINASNRNVIRMVSVPNIVVKPGTVATITVTNLALKPGDTIIIKVVSREGVMAAYVTTIRG